MDMGRRLSGTARWFAHDFARSAVVVAQIACLIRCVREYVVDVTLCVGPSMMPTFNTQGDFVLQERFSVWSNKIKAGDVVVAKSAQTPRYVVCKRVLGVEGDVVKVRPAYGTTIPHYVTVPAGHVWLQGDNAINSTDSRHYGAVPYNMLKGRVFFKVFPFREAGLVARKIPAFQKTVASDRS